MGNNKLIGLLDRIIGYDYWVVLFHPTMDSVVAVASQGRLSFFYSPIWALLSQLPRRGVLFCFTPQSGLCCRSCLARAFFFMLRHFLKKVIFGQNHIF